VITDTTPRYQFYLLQKRDSPLALAPGAATSADPALPTRTLSAAPRPALPQGAAVMAVD
jgi:hypothetical protein